MCNEKLIYGVNVTKVAELTKELPNHGGHEFKPQTLLSAQPLQAEKKTITGRLTKSALYTKQTVTWQILQRLATRITNKKI